MANGLVASCLVVLLAAPAAAAERDECFDSPDYACAIGYALEAAEGIEEAFIKALVLSKIAIAQTEAGDEKGAIATLEAMVATARTTRSASARAWALQTKAAIQADAGNTEGALATIDEIEDVSARDVALWTIATAQTRAGNRKAARSTVEGIEDPSVKAVALASVATALAEADDPKGSACGCREGARAG